MTSPETSPRSSGRPECPIEPFAAEVRADPYPHYAVLQERCPVCWHRDGYWLVSRYADVAALLVDPRCSHWGGTAQQLQASDQVRAITESMRLLSPSGSPQLRNRVLLRLGGRNAEVLREPLETEAERLLSGIAGKPSVEVMSAFAHPFTFFAIALVLGVPDEMAPELSRVVSLLPFPVLALVPLPPADPEFTHVQGTFISLVRRLVEHKRTHRGADLLSDLWAARDEGAALSEQAMVDMAVFLLYAGHHNIMHFFGNALLALLHNPDQMELLRSRPELAPVAVEELLRYDSPVQLIQLVASEDLTVGGQTLLAGEELFVCIGAANRDPEAFPDPGRLDLTRGGPRHLSFGRGPMQCLGTMVARLDAVVGLARLLARFPRLRLQEESPLRWKSQPRVLRGLQTLFLELGESA